MPGHTISDQNVGAVTEVAPGAFWHFPAGRLWASPLPPTSVSPPVRGYWAPPPRGLLRKCEGRHRAAPGFRAQANMGSLDTHTDFELTSPCAISHLGLPEFHSQCSLLPSPSRQSLVPQISPPPCSRHPHKRPLPARRSASVSACTEGR